MDDVVHIPRAETTGRRVLHLHYIDMVQHVFGSEPGVEGENLEADVVFDLTWDGQHYEGLVCRVKQAAGSNFETDHLEVILPGDLPVPVPYDAFRAYVEAYYRSMIGPHGEAFRLGRTKKITIRRNPEGGKLIFNGDQDCNLDWS